MNNVKVSVIIPIYNMGKYLERNLLMLSSQSLKEIEFICVNDNSTDNSLDILLAFKEVFPDRFVVIDSRINRGAGGARNIGLSYARGEYIGFVDADDYANDRMFEDMYNEAKKEDYDIVVCGFYDEAAGLDRPPYIIRGKIGDREKVAFLKKGAFYIWNKIYKKELLEQMSMYFRENIQYQDSDFTMEAVFRAESVSVVERIYYYYKHNEDSTTKKSRYSYEYDIRSVGELAESIEARCEELMDVDLLKFLKTSLITGHFVEMFAFCFFDPNMNYKTFKTIYDFAEETVPEFYNIKVKMDETSFNSIIYNEIGKDPEESYSRLIRLKSRIESGEYDEEVERKKKMEAEKNSDG